MAVVGTGRKILEGSKETGGRDNNNIGDGIGIVRGVGRGSERELGWRRGILGSEWSEWSRMEWSRRVIRQDRQRLEKTSGRDNVVAKT